jgi:phosphoglycerate dehydrogenase-like enzyme
MAADPLRVLFLYDAPPDLRAHLASELSGVPVEAEYAAADHPLDDPGLLERAAQADVLVGWKPSAGLLAAAQRARLFQLPWAGVGPLLPAFVSGNALRAEAGLPPLPLANNHGVCPPTAQHAVAMLLALTNQLVPHHAWMREGRWRLGDSAARSVPLRDDVTVGLLGYGAINQLVHRLLTPFHVRFTALKRHWDNAHSESGDLVLLSCFTPDGLSSFLRTADILVIALPHTPQTEGMLGAEELRLLGADGRERRPRPGPAVVLPGAAGQPTEAPAVSGPLGGLPLLVNVARGAVIEEAALFAALREGTLAGAALDVWYDYQPPPDAQGRRFPWQDPIAHPFHELPNVLLSPHRAASPLDDLRRWDPVIDNLRRLAQGAAPHSVVDLAAGY